MSSYSLFSTSRPRSVFGTLVGGGLIILLFLVPAGAQTDPTEKLPMYGQPDMARPEELQRKDEALIRDAVLKYGSRRAASRAFAEQGWEAFRSGRIDAAMVRFNQSWLLDPKNPAAYWGFGAVLNEQRKLMPAIDQLETAKGLLENPKQRARLLVDLGSLYTEYAVRLPAEQELDRARYFVLANQRFAESLEIEPNDAAGWREWAFSLAAQERYAEAWQKAKRARELNAEPFPEDFLERLRSRVPEAK